MRQQDSVDLQAALRQVESWQSESTSSRMRRFPRFPARGEARLCPVTPYADRTDLNVVHVRDISRGGIGVLSGHPVQVDQCWQLQLIAQHLTMATLPAYCRFCRKVSDGAWLVGLEFGIEASVLLAMGVSSAELVHSDEAPENQKLKGDFLPPEESAKRSPA